MREAFIVSGARTAVGEFGRSLKGIRVVDLGALVIAEAIKRAGLRPSIDDFLKSCRPVPFGEFDQTELNKKYDNYDRALTPVVFDEVIMGHGVQAGQGQSSARQACLYAGMPEETNAYTVNKVCASGMKSIALAAQSILAGDGEAIVAGGMENMSNIPFGLSDARWGYRMTMPYGQITDLMVHDGLFEIFNGYHMGMTAENLAGLYKISREEQDEFGYESHARARAAIASGALADEIVPVTIPQKKGDPLVFQVDERPMDTTLEKMSKLSPVFKKGGDGDGGELIGYQRRCGSGGGDERREDEVPGPEAPGKDRGLCIGRRGSGLYGSGPHPIDVQAFQASGSDDERHGFDRVERGVCCAGPGVHQGAGRGSFDL